MCKHTCQPHERHDVDVAKLVLSAEHVGTGKQPAVRVILFGRQGCPWSQHVRQSGPQQDMPIECVLVLGAMWVLGFVVGRQQCHDVEVPRDKLWLAKSVAHVNGVGLRSRGAAVEKGQRGFIYT